MPAITIDGVSIKYEEMGSGQPVALTPGGRSGMEAVRGLAERLASHYRVIIYDRRNCGASDVAIGGDLSEQEIWADDLHELLSQAGRVARLGGRRLGRMPRLAAPGP